MSLDEGSNSATTSSNSNSSAAAGEIRKKTNQNFQNPKSASGGSFESLVKDDSMLAVAAKKQRVRKSKPCSIGGGEFTELGEMHGRGAGVKS